MCDYDCGNCISCKKDQEESRIEKNERKKYVWLEEKHIKGFYKVEENKEENKEEKNKEKNKEENKEEIIESRKEYVYDKPKYTITIKPKDKENKKSFKRKIEEIYNEDKKSLLKKISYFEQIKCFDNEYFETIKDLEDLIIENYNIHKKLKE